MKYIVGISGSVDSQAALNWAIDTHGPENVVALNGDPKLCVEVGAALLLDKPMVVVVPCGKTILPMLRQLALSVVELDATFSGPEWQAKITAAIGQAVQVIESRQQAGRAL